jgi:nucleoside-triphosphatase THEP1
MVYIITGGIDEGKTRKIEAIYKEKKAGDGWLSKKIFLNNRDFAGYEIVHLVSGETMPLAYKLQYTPTGWDEIYRRGPFSFSGKGFAFCEAIAAKILRSDIEPVFIDEIGPLELNGQGFSAVLTEVLKTGKQLYITVRSHCVRDVTAAFNIDDPVIIHAAA